MTIRLKFWFSFLLIFLLCSHVEAANRKKFNPFTKKLDYIGTDVSGDITIPCESGKVMKAQGGGVWACGDDSGAASGAPTDAEYVVAAANGSLSAEKVIVSGDGVMVNKVEAGFVRVSFDNSYVTGDLSASGGNFSVSDDSHNHTAASLSTDSVSADELNATGVEAELEAVLDLQDFQGAVTDAQVPNNITVDSASAVEGTDLGTLTDTKFCTYDASNTEIDCASEGGSGAPTDADYLVGTANGSLSAEIVVGTSPGGELGGTWASPTLDDSVTVTGWVMGASTATTPAADDNDTSLATTAYVQTEIGALGGTSLTSNSGTLDCDAASTTATGCIEVAIASEVDTGTDTARAVSPDALAGSNLGEKVVSVPVFDSGEDATTGDGKAYFTIPSSLDGMNLVEIHAQVVTTGTTNTINIDIARCATVATGNVCSGTVADVLSTNLTVDSGEDDSSTAAAAAVIDTGNDDVATNQVYRIDCDAVHTTPSKGLIVTFVFRLP